MRKLVFSILVLAAALAVAPAHADDREGREELTAARKRGEIMALAEILDRVRDQIGDRVIEVEFENIGGRIVYEIYYLDGEGHRREILVDAKDASVIEDGEHD